MRPLGVVPEEPVNQGLVESVNIVPQKLKMVLDEVFGKSAIESLYGSIHLRTARIAVVVEDMESGTGIVEEMGKLGAISVRGEARPPLWAAKILIPPARHLIKLIQTATQPSL